MWPGGGYPPTVTNSAATDPPSPRGRRGGPSAVEAAAPIARPRPLVALGAAGAGVLVAAGGLAGGQELGIVALLLCAGVVAFGWPRLVRSPEPVGAATVLGVTSVALAVALLARSQAPLLHHVPIAVAGGVVAMCLHPIVREGARARLVDLLAGTSVGILVLVSGAVLVTTFAVSEEVTAIGVLSVAVVAGVDLLLERPRTAAWMLPAAMLLGGVVGVVVGAVLGVGLAAWPALVGLVSAAVALCLRRALSPQPSMDTTRGALAAGVASVLLVGPVLHALARLPIS